MATMTEAGDVAGLVAATRSGSLDALGALYARFGDAVYGVALRITGSAADAEDVLQDVFVGLPRALASYSERRRFEAWLKRVAASTALMRLRARGRRHEEALDEVAPVATARPMTPHPLDAIALERLIAALPEPLRVVFVLREVEGFSHAEIAAMVGISEGNSAVRLSRAWAALRKEAAK